MPSNAIFNDSNTIDLTGNYDNIIEKSINSINLEEPISSDKLIHCHSPVNLSEPLVNHLLLYYVDLI